MANFPHAQIPNAFQGDEQVAAFMEDVRRALSKLQVHGNAVTWKVGSGSPEGVVSAAQGSLYTRLDGGATTTLYVKTLGAGPTGWTAK